MTQIYRELTGREKQRIKKLITSRCANYDKEYGCLPLDCECPMFGICYTNSALCRKFRNALLPTAPELQAVFQPMPLTVCKQCGKVFPKEGKPSLFLRTLCRRSQTSADRSQSAEAQSKAETRYGVTILLLESLVPQGFLRAFLRL